MKKTQVAIYVIRVCLVIALARWLWLELAG